MGSEKSSAKSGGRGGGGQYGSGGVTKMDTGKFGF